MCHYTIVDLRCRGCGCHINYDDIQVSACDLPAIERETLTHIPSFTFDYVYDVTQMCWSCVAVNEDPRSFKAWTSWFLGWGRIVVVETPESDTVGMGIDKETEKTEKTTEKTMENTMTTEFLGWGRVVVETPESDRTGMGINKKTMETMETKETLMDNFES